MQATMQARSCIRLAQGFPPWCCKGLSSRSLILSEKHITIGSLDFK
uniref:Uncharacterized protein n=1 Tax=Arundo donax TaxID=35708 RepID=A0A0A9H1F5_ARUDO